MATAARPVRPVTESSCGLPGDLEHSDDTKSWTNPKVGGQPVFPGSVPPVEAVFCAKCGRHLLLVAQVQATAHQGHTLQDRVLMLWACTAESCIAEPASWRAISCMLPVTTALPPNSTTASSNHFPAMPAELDWTSTPADQPRQHSPDSGAWGSAANDWGSPTATPQPSTTPSPHSVFDYKDLEQALDSYQQYDRPQHSSKGKQAASALPQTADADSCSMDLHGSQLPGFYVNMVPEAAAMKADMSAEDQHIAELLAAYEKAYQEAAPSHSAEQLPDESWAGEAYETDSAGALLKFQQHMQSCPQQCIRQGGQPLWPSKPIPEAGQCQHCGSERVFEMQILPPLMHYLEETCTWMMDDDSGAGDQIKNGMQALAGWQWLTVAVFICPRQCLVDGSATQQKHVCTMQEELVLVANEHL